MTIHNDYLTIVQFAAKIQMHPNSVRRLIRMGKLQGVNMGSGNRKIYRIPESELSRLATFDLKEVLTNIRSDDLK